MATLIGNEIPSPVDATTQVYKVTHVGTDRLSLRQRSFISFTYGGKHIEDFNLIATISGSKMQRSVYSQFEDLTTTYDMVDGQFYWGTHYVNNTLDFNLSTDEMTDQQLNEFKRWFKAGTIRELVLAENPNRAIYARVSAPPVYSFLPFEKKINVNIAGQSYTTSTTVYRGDIGITFIMDDPFWFARNNKILPYYTSQDDKFGSMATKGTMATLSDPDFIKVIAEDGVPYETMLEGNILIGDAEQAFDISSNKSCYFYYCGTAPSAPIIKFTLKSAFVNDLLAYPLNSYSRAALDNEGSPIYNTITIGSQELRFTAPSMYLGYNQAITIMKNFQVGASAEEARGELRDGVNEYYARSWAIFVLDTMIKNNDGVSAVGAFTSGFFGKFSTYMRYFLTQEGGSSDPFPLTITINCQTGEVIGNFQCRVANLEKELPKDAQGFKEESIFILEENVEDMIRSDYIKIEDRNYPNSEGKITTEQCNIIKTDYRADMGGLVNCSLTYKNLYL